MMSWLKRVFGIPEQKHSATIAKERLMVIVAHERGNHETQPDFLPLLQKELTEVIAKYVRIDKNQVQVDFEQKGGRSVLELNVTLPDHQLRSNVKPMTAEVPAMPKPVVMPASQVVSSQNPSQPKAVPAKPKAASKKAVASSVKKSAQTASSAKKTGAVVTKAKPKTATKPKAPTKAKPAIKAKTTKKGS